MKKNRLDVSLILAIALVISGCSGTGEQAGGKSAAAATSSNADAAIAAPTSSSGANSATANGAAVAPAQPGANVNMGQPVASQGGGGARGGNNAPPAKMPTSKIGSGGNDFYLFTQARGALNADAELKAANVVVDVKDGAVTLSGTVANAEQKSKAEQLVRAVGSKSVKNQLRVSGGN
jgi:hypothetical protein